MDVRRFSIFWTELNSYEDGSALVGVIYIHRISDNRFGGIAGRNFEMFRKLCGDTALKNVVLVTNMWGEVSRDIGDAREKELSSKFFKPALDFGAQMVRHDNTVQSAHDIIRRVAANRPVVLQIQRELVDERKDIVKTAAGEAINRELSEQIRRHQAELKAVQEGMMQALREKDEETREELEEERRRLQERMKELAKDSEGMGANYAAEKERMRARVKGMDQEAKRERERVEAKGKRQLAGDTRRFQDEPNPYAAGQTMLEQEMPQVRSDGPGDNGLVTIPIY